SGEPTQLFKFSWDPYGIVVDDHFWLALEDKKDDGWSTLAPDTYWEIAGPHFCLTILSSGMPIYHENVKKRRVPWTEVEKVYFPLNEPEVHWALAELHIGIGVIIVYDSMNPRKKKMPQ
nr:phospholipase-like protein [Tanacetum cinerariifolium]